MKYDDRIDHTIILDEEETNRFFDPFNAFDAELPSYLRQSGHRFIKEDIYEWLIVNVGEPHRDWTHVGNRRTREFQFLKKDKAMLFKLTFSNP